MRPTVPSPRHAARAAAVAVLVPLLGVVAAPESLGAQARAAQVRAAQAPLAASILITAPELNALRQRDPSVVLLHVGPKEDYDKGHIAGARFVTMRDLSVENTAANLNLELPPENDLRSRLENLGISDRSNVVVTFGEGWGSPATRILFTLQTAGLGARSRFLDGGTAAWAKAGLPLSKDAPAPATAGKLTTAAERSLVVDHEWMSAHASAPRTRIVDGRAPMFYEGPPMTHGSQTHPAGHLRGAVNIPFNSLVDADVRMLPLDALRAAFTKAGVQPGDTVAAYCHIGQQATTVILAARLLGHPVRLYDGSMNDWENRKLPLVNEKSGK